MKICICLIKLGSHTMICCSTMLNMLNMLNIETVLNNLLKHRRIIIYTYRKYEPRRESERFRSSVMVRLSVAVLLTTQASKKVELPTSRV